MKKAQTKDEQDIYALSVNKDGPKSHKSAKKNIRIPMVAIEENSQDIEDTDDEGTMRQKKSKEVMIHRDEQDQIDNSGPSISLSDVDDMTPEHCDSKQNYSKFFGLGKGSHLNLRASKDSNTSYTSANDQGFKMAQLAMKNSHMNLMVNQPSSKNLLGGIGDS